MSYRLHALQETDRQSFLPSTRTGGFFLSFLCIEETTDIYHTFNGCSADAENRQHVSSSHVYDNKVVNDVMNDSREGLQLLSVVDRTQYEIAQ